MVRKRQRANQGGSSSLVTHNTSIQSGARRAQTHREFSELRGSFSPSPLSFSLSPPLLLLFLSFPLSSSLSPLLERCWRGDKSIILSDLFSFFLFLLYLFIYFFFFFKGRVKEKEKGKEKSRRRVKERRDPDGNQGTVTSSCSERGKARRKRDFPTSFAAAAA